MVFCFRKRKSSRLTASLRGFLSELQQTTAPSGDRVVGDWRDGETAQLLKGRVGMVESELAGGFKIVRNVVAEDFKGLADLIAGFRGGLGATAKAQNLGEGGDEHRCHAPDAQGGYRFSKAMENPGFIGVADIQRTYLPMGFENFKIEGRELGSALVLEFLLYYLTKPECQLKVREEIYLDNMLDLF